MFTALTFHFLRDAAQIANLVYQTVSKFSVHIRMVKVCLRPQKLHHRQFSLPLRAPPLTHQRGGGCYLLTALSLSVN